MHKDLWIGKMQPTTTLQLGTLFLLQLYAESQQSFHTMTVGRRNTFGHAVVLVDLYPLHNIADETSHIMYTFHKQISFSTVLGGR